ncbi:MAG: hypothetical protein K940chlam7_00150 [Chlamydiae bacterium]|nr:hypothetical protein [Chlamydiota bacterium]
MDSIRTGGSLPIEKPAGEDSTSSSTTHKPISDPLIKKSMKIGQEILNNRENELDLQKVDSLREHKANLKIKLQRKEKLKSKIGKLFSNLPIIKGKQKEQLTRTQEEYSQVKKAYQDVVSSSPTLKYVKEIRKMKKIANAKLFKAEGDWKKVDTAFATQFDELARDFKMLGDLKGMLGPKTAENKARWNSFSDRLVRGIEQIRTSEALSRGQITWLHGTRSPALAVMLATDKTLHPTGDLLEKNIFPLSGELGMGISEGGVNRANISGTPLSKLGVEVTTSYAKDFKAGIQEEWDHLSETRLREVLKLTEDTLKNDPKLQGRFASGTKFDWLSTQIYMERLKVIDPEFQGKVSQLDETIMKLITECKQEKKEYLAPFLEKLLEKTGKKPFIQPTQEIRDCVTDSFPIVLGSQTVVGKLIAPHLDEHIVEGALKLEKTQIAFTDAQYVERLQGYVDDAGLEIEVMDFSALYVLGSQAQESGNPPSLKAKKLNDR